MKKTIILFLTFATFVNVAAQTNYYVDVVNGNDLNNGTSLSSTWKTIQKACNTATPNSIVQIKAGTYNENIVVNVSGTIGNPITIKNYLNDVVLIDGTIATGTTMLTISNKNYLNFENLTIQNRTVNNAQGILVETTGANTSTGLSFSNITISNINWINNAATIPTATDNAQAFIALGRNGGISNITIDNCHVFNNILGFSEAISLDGNINGFTIQNCLVHDNTNIGIVAIGNYTTSTPINTDHARNGTIKNNVCYKNVSLYATSGGIYIDGGNNIVVSQNKCYENGNGIEVGCEQNGTTDNITVRDNLVFNNNQSGISVGGYTATTTGQVTNSTIRNNTLFENNSSNDGTGEIVISKASNCSFENNIIYSSSQSVLMSVDNILPQSGNSLNYNCWFTPQNNPSAIVVNWRGLTYTTFPSYQTGTSQDVNSLFSNPNLNNAALPSPELHILATSPCVNTGKSSTLVSVGEKTMKEIHE